MTTDKMTHLLDPYKEVLLIMNDHYDRLAERIHHVDNKLTIIEQETKQHNFKLSEIERKMEMLEAAHLKEIGGIEKIKSVSKWWWTGLFLLTILAAEGIYDIIAKFLIKLNS